MPSVPFAKPNAISRSSPGVGPKDLLALFLLTAAAFLIHGYHPGAEDAEIYVPQVRKLLHPGLYPFGSELFESHAHLTLFPKIIAGSVRLSHLPLAAVLLIWHLAAIFLFLLACWKISARLWPGTSARLAAVGLVAALLTIPVAGTKLYLLDQYLNPRSISAFTILFAIDAAISRRYALAALWLVATALVHPLMAAFGVLFVLLLALDAPRIRPAVAAAAIAWPGFLAAHPSAAYWQCLHSHAYYHLLEWQWYEWLGLVAPLAIVLWFERRAARRGEAELQRLARVVFIFAAICFVGALVVMIPAKFELLSIYQPARGFQLIYVFMFLMAGGSLGESILKCKPARWLILFVPLCFAMFYAQLRLFPADRHIEWPGAASPNPWMQAFDWIRSNTPQNAVFALDPNYMALPGEDQQGFRAIAARSSLADANKDWSAAVMFPGLPLADECLKQIRAASPWNSFDDARLEQLKQTYGVTWVILDSSRPQGLVCPYRNSAVSVCQLH